MNSIINNSFMCSADYGARNNMQRQQSAATITTEAQMVLLSGSGAFLAGIVCKFKTQFKICFV
jgi:hypothetical protein